MNSINNKIVLLIGIGFYDYEKCIIEALNKRGAKVSYFSSSYNSFAKRFLQRLGLNNYARLLASKNILRKISNQPDKIDLIIVIKAENMEQEHLALINNKYKQTHKVLYLWDSLNRLPNKDLLLRNFDTILTFDRKDAIEYNLFFRPLFYRERQTTESSDIDYDISFVGRMHSHRYKIIHELKKKLDADGLSYKLILYTGKFTKFVNLYLTHKFFQEDKEIFVTKRISFEEYSEISKRSNVILDISHPLQSGLTMRTIETFGFGKKLLTTNSDIIHYNLHNDSYRVLDDDYNIDCSYIKERKIIKEDVSPYSLDCFVDDILKCAKFHV